MTSLPRCCDPYSSYAAFSVIRKHLPHKYPVGFLAVSLVVRFYPLLAS